MLKILILKDSPKMPVEELSVPNFEFFNNMLSILYELELRIFKNISSRTIRSPNMEFKNNMHYILRIFF